jgi:hypothetical protein
MKVARLPALRNGRLYPPVDIPGTHLCHKLSRSQGHSAARRIMSMKNSFDTIGNEPSTFRLVVQCLNQLRHSMPYPLLGGPKKYQYMFSVLLTIFFQPRILHCCCSGIPPSNCVHYNQPTVHTGEKCFLCVRTSLRVLHRDSYNICTIHNIWLT